MFHKESYERHGDWYNQQFPTEESKRSYLTKRKPLNSKDLGTWLQKIFFSSIDPLLKKKHQNWLTVGDPYGYDAEYILHHDNNAVASDLNTDMLQVAFDEGVITDFCVQNAEQLSFEDQKFDFVLCKESYHHFPRPYAALYEMVRVAKQGIVIIEPQDPVTKMPALLFIVNLLASIGDSLVKKVWKNRFSYEPVGNFVYKVSEREFEKFCAGLNLPLVAFKRINPNFYFKGADTIPVSLKNGKYRGIFLKKSILDLLVKAGLIPSQVLATIVFKEVPDEGVIRSLKASGYRLLNIPRNPYLKD